MEYSETFIIKSILKKAIRDICWLSSALEIQAHHRMLRTNEDIKLIYLVQTQNTQFGTVEQTFFLKGRQPIPNESPNTRMIYSQRAHNVKITSL